VTSALTRLKQGEAVRDQRIAQVVPLVAPRELLDELPLSRRTTACW
jgi:hypothetical protein